MSRFEAIDVDAATAVSTDVHVRRALASALASPFLVVADPFVLDELANDADADVCTYARLASRVRGLVPSFCLD